MKVNIIYFVKYLTIIMSPLMVISCTKDDPIVQVANYFKVGETITSDSSINVQFFSKDSLFVGYNKVFFKVKDRPQGQDVNNASIILHPLMNMGTTSHACPVENPSETPNADGYFEGAIIFSMPGSNNTWSLSADIVVNGLTSSAKFPISKIISTNPVKKIVIIDSLKNNQGSWTVTKHPVSIIEPSTWKVGNNPFEITVHTMESMMSFPCCNEMTIEITPEMPSMGHGSPNNVNPVAIGNGHYLGTVNFTMTGAWRINMIFKKGDRIIGRNAYFDINF